MPFGYNNKICFINLSEETCRVEEKGEVWYRTYMGGGCLASYFLINMLKPDVQPLSPQNVIVFATSVVTGAPLSGFSRYTVAAKSPLTNGFGESEAGGYFGPELKFSGFDALVIEGKAKKPVYLWVHDSKVEIKDASQIWGLENGPALDAIRKELGDKKVRVASIGPAGERLISYSNVINELGHANGRNGLGAVMGSKNLKAVACRGSSKNIDFADYEKVREIMTWHNSKIKMHPPNKLFGEDGTATMVMTLNNSGGLPTRNWREGVFQNADKINAESLKKILIRRHTCYRCAVGCKRVVGFEKPYKVDPRYGGPEFETLGAFGSLCGVDDIKAIAKANEICNRNGLDTISTGGVVAFAMECFEEGILGEKEGDDRVIKFGDAQGMLWLIEQIVNRDGIGDILAKGVKVAAEEIGEGAEKYAFHVKGQEPPLHDPRVKTGQALSYSLCPRGADHLDCPHDPLFQGQGVSMLAPLGITEPIVPYDLDGNKVRFFKKGNISWSMNNTLGICNFVMAPLFAMKYEKLVAAVQAITGWETSLEELLEAGERAKTLARIFNIIHGVDYKQDKLYSRLHEPMPSGPAKGQIIDKKELKEAIKLYYKMMGWDEKGIPTEAALIELNIAWANKFIKKK